MSNRNSIELIGTVEKIIIQKPGFVVFRIKNKADDRFYDATSDFDKITPGDELKIEGLFSKTPYGVQLKSHKTTILNKNEDVNRERQRSIALLQSISGIGKKKAELIVNKLGDNAVDIILNNPDSLDNVSNGIKNIKKQIYSNLQTQYSNSKHNKITNYLLRINNNKKVLSNEDSQKIWDHFFRGKSLTLEEFASSLNKNPYILSDVLSFEKTDMIAKSIFNIEESSDERIKAGIMHIVKKESVQKGHCYTSKKNVIKKTKTLLDNKYRVFSEDDISMYIIDLVNENKLFIPINPATQQYTNSVYLKEISLAENYTAKRIKEIKQETSIPLELPTLIKEYENINNLKLDNEQIEAIKNFWSTTFSILCGAPGTGKTSTVNAILFTVKYIQPNASILLTSHTANATKTLAKATNNQFTAKTLYRALKIYNSDIVSDYHYKENPLDYDIIIVDETEMVDIKTIKALLMAISKGTRLLLIGDVNQLPAIGAGAVLRDLTKRISFTELKTIHRTKKDSFIPYFCKDILDGNIPQFDNKDTLFIEIEDTSKIKEKIISEIENYKKHGYSNQDIQVITPRRTGIDLSSEELSVYLQNYYNIKNKCPNIFWPGDTVIQTQNRYDLGVINGSFGIVKNIKKNNDIVVHFYEENLDIEYPLGIIKDNLALAYSLTVHRAIGREFPIVILILSSIHKKMLTREIFYTAASRAKQKLIVIGDREALETAVMQKSPPRLTTLQYKL